jgi:hypothetical protein
VKEQIVGSEKGRLDKDRTLEKYRSKASEYKQKLRLALQNL